MNSIIEMNQLKLFLQGDISWVDPSVIEKLQQYDTIKVDSTIYPTTDIIQRIQQQGCSHCMEVNTYLREFQLQILYTTDSEYKYLIDDIIGDTSKNYRKLKIRRK